MDLFYFEFEAPNGINLIMFRDSSVTFSANIRKKKIKGCFLVINLLMPQNRGYSILNGLISHRVAHKTSFLKTQINKKHTLISFWYLHRMFIEYSEEYT